MMSNNEIVFLYTKNFQWKDGGNKIVFNNKPETKRVYIAAKDIDSGFYRLILPNGGAAAGIILDTLEVDSAKWTCDFIPLTYTNILDFDIHPDDVTMITEEIDSRKTSEQYPGMLEEEPVDDMTMYARDKQADYTVMDALNNLRVDDRLAYETVAGLVQYLATRLSMQEGDTFVDNMILEGTNLGKGGSMALILNELQDYMLYDHEPHKLVRSIYYIMLEIMRYKLNAKYE